MPSLELRRLLLSSEQRDRILAASRLLSTYSEQAEDTEGLDLANDLKTLCIAWECFSLHDPPGHVPIDELREREWEEAMDQAEELGRSRDNLAVEGIGRHRGMGGP